MREAKGITQQSIADHTNISKAQVSRIENGTRRATRPFVEQVDRILRGDGALIKLWEDLNRNGHPVPIWFDWPKIEADAASLVSWEPMLIAGLVQTPWLRLSSASRQRRSRRSTAQPPGDSHRAQGTCPTGPGAPDR
ncbi:helix-turn-helix domain-containing protein [Actinomadura madurae]|uniref:helix-turn-helix domain-containing protein n=1 Tax=Actinomadura madurae TaxID=1993 RepID=UPI003D6AA5B5